jgi:hypothetical protein
VSELITTGEAALDLGAFRMERFTAGSVRAHNHL